MAIQLLQGLDIRSTEPVDARVVGNLIDLNRRLVYDGLIAYQDTDATGNTPPGLAQGVYVLTNAANPDMTASWSRVDGGAVNSSATVTLIGTEGYGTFPTATTLMPGDTVDSRRGWVRWMVLPGNNVVIAAGEPAPNLAVTNPRYEVVYDNTPLTVTDGTNEVTNTHTINAGTGLSISGATDTATINIDIATAIADGDNDIVTSNLIFDQGYIDSNNYPSGTVPMTWAELGGDGELIYGRHRLINFVTSAPAGIVFDNSATANQFYNDLPADTSVAIIEFDGNGIEFQLNQGNFNTPTGEAVTFVADGAPTGWPTDGDGGQIEIKLAFSRVEGGTGVSTSVDGDTLTINTNVPALPARNGNTQYLSVTLPPAGGGVATWGQTVQTIPSGNGEYNLTIANGLPSWTIDSNTPTAGGLGVSYTLSDDVTTRTVGTSAVIEFSSEREAIRFFRLLPTVAGGQEITLDGTAYTLVYNRAAIRRTDNILSFGATNILQIAGVDQPWPTNTAIVTLTAVVAETGVPTINEEDGNVDLSWDAVTNTFSANVDISSRYAPGDPVILQTLFPNESTNTPVPSQLAQTDAVVREQLGVVGFELLAPFAYNPGADQNAVQTFTFAATNVDAAEYIGDLQAKAAHYAVFNSGEQVALLYTQSPPMIGEDLVYNVLGWFDRNVAIRLTPFISIPEIENGRIWVLDDTDTFVSNDRLEEVRHEIPTDIVTHSTSVGIPYIVDQIATIPQHLNSRSTIRFTITSGGHTSHHDSILDFTPGTVNVNGAIDTTTAYIGARYTCYFPADFAFAHTGADYYTTPEVITTVTATPIENSMGNDGDYYFQTVSADTTELPVETRERGIYRKDAGTWVLVPNNDLGRMHLREVRERSVGDGSGNTLREVVFELLNQEALWDLEDLTGPDTNYVIPPHRRQGDRIGVYVGGSEDDITINNVVLATDDPITRGLLRFRHESEALDFFDEATSGSFTVGGTLYTVDDGSMITRNGRDVTIPNTAVTPDFHTLDGSIHNEIFTSMAGVSIDTTPTSEVIFRFENSQVNEFFQRDRDLFLDHLPPSGPVVMEVDNHYYWFDNAAAFQHSESSNLNDVFYNLGRGGFYGTQTGVRTPDNGTLRILNPYTVTAAFTAPITQGAFFRRLSPNEIQVLSLGNIDIQINYANGSIIFPTIESGQGPFTIGGGTPSSSTIGVSGVGSTVTDPDGYLTAGMGLSIVANDIHLNRPYVTGTLPIERFGDGIITGAKLDDNTITSRELDVDSVDHAALDTDAVHAENILDGEVGSAELDTDAVTTIKIEDGAVTDVKGGRLSTTKELNGNAFKVSVMGATANQAITFDVYDGIGVASIPVGELYIVRIYNTARVQLYRGLRFYTTGTVGNTAGTFGVGDNDTITLSLLAQESSDDPAILPTDLGVGSTVTFEKFDSDGLLTGGFLLPEGTPFGSRSTYIDTVGKYFIQDPTAAGTLADPRGIIYYQDGDAWYLTGQGGTEVVSF